MPKQVVIIGGGIGGLATANILAKAGFSVTVVEAREQLGGRAGILKAKGFTFDTGPSWYLMPEVYDDYFKLLDTDVHDLIDLVRLDPGYQVYFGNKKPVLVTADLAANRALFERIEPGSGPFFDHYLARSELAYRVATKHFLYTPFTRLHRLISLDVLKHVPSLIKLTTRSLHGYVSSYFKTSQAQQLLEYPAVFLGASPYMTPALFSLMSYLDFKQGVYYPRGGMYEVVLALERVGKQLGVQYMTGVGVSQVLTEQGRATGVKLATGEEILADIVVSNADLRYSETQLLPKELRTYPEAYWKRKQPGPSAILIYLGIKGRLPQLQHHNLMFIDTWEENFADTFDRHVWSEPASLYVCAPSVTDDTVAPKDHENIFMLIPGPSGEELDDEKLQRLATSYIAQLAKVIKQPDLIDRIVYRSVFGPSQFTEEFHAWQGTALGAAHTLGQSALFRPSNKSKKVKNLYYVGAGAQPGIGVPLCLISAQLVYKHIAGDHSSGPLSAIRVLEGDDA